MNKRSIMTKSVAIAMGMVGLVHADNSSLQLDNWTGFNLGVDLSVVTNNAHLRSQQLGFTTPGEHCDTKSDLSTFSPGLQLGYTYQFANDFVGGVELGANFNANQKDILACNCSENPMVSDSFLFRNQRQSTIKGRAGRAIAWHKGKLLPYLTTGARFADTELSYQNEGDDYYLQNNTQAGWLIGAGVEWSYSKNWSLRAEYSYVDYGNTIKLRIPSVYGLIDPNGHARVNLNANTLLIAISYWL